MIEVLNQMVNRLGQDPHAIAELVKKRSLCSDQLHNSLNTMREREINLAGYVADRRKQDGSLVFPNQDLRAAETLRLLAIDNDYQTAKTFVDETRQQLREFDSELEMIGRRNNADQKIIALVTAYISNGMQQEANSILNAYMSEEITSAAAIQNTVENAVNQTIRSGNQNSVATDGVFLVLEARPSRSPETIRAYCEGTDGRKVAVYAKNGNGQMLVRSLGKRVKIECTPGDKGLFAYKVEPVA